MSCIDRNVCLHQVPQPRAQLPIGNTALKTLTHRNQDLQNSSKSQPKTGPVVLSMDGIIDILTYTAVVVVSHIYLIHIGSLV